MDKGRLTFKKSEKLKNQKEISLLFEKGRSFIVYPVRITWLMHDREGSSPIRAAFGVSRKYFRNAVDRNSIKRRMREIYRLNKSFLYSSTGNRNLLVMFYYVGAKKLSYSSIEKAFLSAFDIIIRNKS
jgi:ribonuclease P protein component